MRIFITGGTGFIGKYVMQELTNADNTLLLLLLESENAPRLPNKAKVNILRGDLSRLEILKSKIKQFSPEATVHLAWESLPNYDAETSIKNLNYGLNLISLVAECGCKTFIGTGSCWEYGQPSGKVNEDAGVKPYNAFSAAKNSLHWLGREIAREKDMHFIWTRLFYVYGPGQRETSLIPHIISSLRNGVMPEIKTPQTKNDFIYVEDVARAISSIVNKSPKYGVYNIGSAIATSVRQIVEIVCDKFNFTGKCDMLSNVASSPVVDFWADISRIKTEIGWEPRISISEGIEKVIKFYTQDSGQ
jgi:nucleoside-diphosphate-sugar epimerase